MLMHVQSLNFNILKWLEHAFQVCISSHSSHKTESLTFQSFKIPFPRDTSIF